MQEEELECEWRPREQVLLQQCVASHWRFGKKHRAFLLPIVELWSGSKHTERSAVSRLQFIQRIAKEIIRL